MVSDSLVFSSNVRYTFGRSIPYISGHLMARTGDLDLTRYSDHLLPSPSPSVTMVFDLSKPLLSIS